jgi:transposase
VEETLDKSAECGIDVSAKQLWVVLRRQGVCEAQRSFANTAAGHKELKRYLIGAAERVRICLESTGLYGLDVALYLHADPRLEVMVANPRAVKDFAKALLQRSKSDPLDAGVLAEYAGRMPFRAWQPPSSAALAVTALARRIHALTETATREKNRLHALAVTDTTVKILVTELKRSLQWIERSQARLTREARRMIAGEELLERRFQLLLSLPGVGETSALQLLGELALLPADAEVRQWVAYAGLDPCECSSGSSLRKRPRISKVGNRHLRRALFMPALTAARHNETFAAYYGALQARGKCKMVALVAIMRKLLHATFGMFKHDAMFDGNRVFRLPATAAGAAA